MKVVIKEPHKKPIVTEIENKLKIFQEIVSGNIQIVEMPFCGKKSIHIIMNDEGKIKKYEPNILYWHGDVIVGTVIFVASNNENLIGLDEEQVELVKAYSCMFDYDN